MPKDVYFKEDVEKRPAFSNTTVPGFWLVLCLCVAFIIGILVMSSLGFIDNQNIVEGKDEEYKDAIKWMGLVAIIVLVASFLITPFLIFSSPRVATTYFLFTLLGMSLLTTVLLTYAQSNNVPGNDNFVSAFEETVHWTMIGMMGVSSVSFIGLLVLIFSTSTKYKSKMDPIKSKMMTPISQQQQSIGNQQTPVEVTEAMNMAFSPSPVSTPSSSTLSPMSA